jgi:hypothetical protein
MSSHPKSAPTLPKVVDEAGDTPGWVPALGVGLFALAALLIVVRFAWVDSSATPKAAPPAVAEAPSAPSAPNANR